MDHIEARLEHSQRVFLNFDLGGHDVRFGRVNHLEPVDDTTGSTHALGIAKQWLETCRTSPAHSRCREAYQNISNGSHSSLPRLPTRILHVGSGNQDPYLVESHGARARYCILSYCWGRPGTAITTKVNKPERQKGIPLTSLPTLIHESILTTRSLDFKYLWVDASCIIQDDPDDWAREASQMHELYACADLIITSLVAGDSWDKPFQHRPQDMTIYRPIPLHLELPKWDRPEFVKGDILELAVYPPKDMIFEDYIGPVHQRAWILQEQAMSTRLLYFEARMLHWECLDR
ncbi:heterokaryon incompatibility protein [Colletotrichum sojae]|uniref:Heterokaryon incompatibility protein n=1 Tax=Colletotrichum sojae TaxID=2175907 RepID=A0A8H6IUM6_9PEZI|nr:heterokaryon incompatibility protein [Colletotrichum sojae]